MNDEELLAEFGIEGLLGRENDSVPTTDPVAEDAGRRLARADSAHVIDGEPEPVQHGKVTRPPGPQPGPGGPRWASHVEESTEPTEPTEPVEVPDTSHAGDVHVRAREATERARRAQEAAERARETAERTGQRAEEAPAHLRQSRERAAKDARIVAERAQRAAELAMTRAQAATEVLWRTEAGEPAAREGLGDEAVERERRSDALRVAQLERDRIARRAGEQARRDREAADRAFLDKAEAERRSREQTERAEAQAQTVGRWVDLVVKFVDERRRLQNSPPVERDTVSGESAERPAETAPSQPRPAESTKTRHDEPEDDVRSGRDELEPAGIPESLANVGHTVLLSSDDDATHPNEIALLTMKDGVVYFMERAAITDDGDIGTSALTTRFEENKNRYVAHLEHRLDAEEAEHRRRALADALAAIRSGDFRRAVTNAGVGRQTLPADAVKRLRRRGIDFVDVRASCATEHDVRPPDPVPRARDADVRAAPRPGAQASTPDRGREPEVTPLLGVPDLVHLAIKNFPGAPPGHA